MIVLINPNLVVQRDDPFTTGIVYMPLTLAYTASYLQDNNIPVKVIDAFAEKPKQGRRHQNFVLMGLNPSEILTQIPETTTAIIVYAINLNNHLSTIEIIRALKKEKPIIPVVILENTQSVTGYSLQKVATDFYDAGADYILTGEGERRSLKFIQTLQQKNFSALNSIDGLGSRDFYNSPKEMIEDIDALPFPSWTLFPLKNYWRLGFAHGPLSAKSYLPLLTSRGCPYPCRFCVIPATNNLKWRARSARNVVDEIEFSIKTYQVTEFHIEDLDPTVSDKRTREICQEIINRGLKIRWKISAGTKSETIKNEETLSLMAKAGCNYISISPETGSERLLKTMNKPFRLNHALKLTKRMNDLRIFSQACFVLGFPGETDEDRAKTHTLVRNLAQAGVDEVALFIITPVPGSAIFSEFDKEKRNYRGLWELTFSPTWREDYKNLNRWRLRIYRTFIFQKFLYHPFKIMRQCFNFLRRRFDTKMEMVPYRALVWTLVFSRISNR